MPSTEEIVRELFQASRAAQAMGDSCKTLLKWIVDRADFRALLACMTPDDRQWLLKAIRSTTVRNKRHAQRLVEIAAAIEQEINPT